ncbi:MAG: squalene/phytoene synthase family protein [Bacteroidales bacterium]|nr:squalene/phytoene synthase family protein [Bacteroidales bacterium]
MKTKSEAQSLLEHIDFESITKHPNILIAAKFWDEERYEAAKTCYRFMRAIDDLIDDKKAALRTFSAEEKQQLTQQVNSWINSIDELDSEDPFITGLVDTIRRFKIPLKLFHNFARSMLYDINHNGFKTFHDFITYAEGASVAPASVFIHLCCLKQKNGEYYPPAFDVTDVARPCAIFSYIVHIIRDFQKDQFENLNYFSDDILTKYGLTAPDLQEIARSSNIPLGFRDVIREYLDQARIYSIQTLMQIDNLVPRLDSRYLLSLKIIYGLYLQVYNRIDAEHGRFTMDELNPGMQEVKQFIADIINEEYCENSQTGNPV